MTRGKAILLWAALSCLWLGVVGFLAGCATTDKTDLSKCYRPPTEAEFFCDDCPEANPERCGVGQ